MARVFLCAAVVVSFAAAPAFAGADNLEPASARGFLAADDAKVAPHLGVSALVLESWIKDPVVLRGADGRIVKKLVPQQWTSTVAATVGLFDRLELSVAAGGAAVQGGTEWGMELVDPRVTLKALLVETGPLSFAARATAGGPEEWRVEPGAIATLELPFVTTGVDVGTRITAAGDVAFTWAAGARVPLFDERISLDADLFGEVAPEGIAWQAPVEGTVGATAHIGDFAAVFADVGGGLVAGYGTPNLRALAGVRFSFAPSRDAAKPAAVVAPAPTAPPPVLVAEDAAPEPPKEEPKAEEPAAPVVALVTEDTIEFSQDVVLFDPESDKLVDGAVQPLNAVAQALAEHPEITKVVIEGHCDSRGTVEYNDKLSLWRALVVKRYLVGAGVAASRLDVHANGKSKPRASNDTVDGRRANRRVEFNVTDHVPVSAERGAP